MAQNTPIWKQRGVWVGVVGLASLAFWVVGVGAGARGWILSANDGGIVSHAQSFGEAAYIWWVPATILTLTTVVMAIGISVVRRLQEGPVEAKPALEPREERKALPQKRSVPSDDANGSNEKSSATESK